MPTLYLISKSKSLTARWEQACLEQPDGDEVIVPCSSNLAKVCGDFCYQRKRDICTESPVMLHTCVWGMRERADLQGLHAQRPLWGHGLSCVSREGQTVQADRGAESLRPPVPQHSPPRAAEASGPRPYMEQRANMGSVTV